MASRIKSQGPSKKDERRQDGVVYWNDLLGGAVLTLNKKGVVTPVKGATTVDSLEEICQILSDRTTTVETYSALAQNPEDSNLPSSKQHWTFSCNHSQNLS